MAVKENSLGMGTIAYHGESPEYWAEKTRRLPRGRAMVTIGLALAGLLPVTYAGSPLAPSAVTGTITQTIASNDTEVTHAIVTYPHGSGTKEGKVTLSGAHVDGQHVALLVRPGGVVTQGDPGSTDTIWGIGVLLLLVAGGRQLWAWRRRGERITFS